MGVIVYRPGSQAHLLSPAPPARMGRYSFHTLCGKGFNASAGWQTSGRETAAWVCRNCARIEASRLTGDCEQDCQDVCAYPGKFSECAMP